MPFAGYLVYTGELNLWLVSIAGGIGCTIGSAFSWWIGKKGGRPLVERYGRYVLLSAHDLDLGEKWFKRWGNSIAFFSRLLPIVRTFISFPAGIAQVPLGRFLAYTFVGSVIWSYFLAYIGLKLGENWEHIEVYWRKFDYIILALILVGLAWWVWRHFRKR
jgi:membrane protein DedA with SNARE-associated domain